MRMIGLVLVLGPLGWLSLSALNGWTDANEWSLGSRVLFSSCFVTAVFAYGVEASFVSGRARTGQRLPRGEDLTTEISLAKAQAGHTEGSAKVWAVMGVVLFGCVGNVVFDDRVLGPKVGLGAFIALPLIGGTIGFILSPHMQAVRALRELQALAEARERESPETRFNREHNARSPQAVNAEWRQRVYDALIWWSSEGARLTSDSEFMLALVRRAHGKSAPDSKAITERYQDPNDPCLNRERAERVAAWAMEHLPELVTEHVEESRRSIAGVTEILRHHQRREINLYREARAYALHEAIEAHLNESPEHLVERLLKESDSVALAREKGLQRIREAATKLQGEARERYVQAATAAVNAMLDAWLFARSRDVRPDA